MARKKSPDRIALEQLSGTLTELVAVAGAGQNAAGRRRILNGLARFAERVEGARAEIDKIRIPKAVFDPFEPRTSGRMVALALLAQPLVRLSAVPDSYGSGIYAIYYNGDHPLYAAVSGTETPIYVGKADPELVDARTPREQGSKLTGRLREHAGTISEAESHAASRPLPAPLHAIRLEDFWCRRLVCATNAQLVAEVHLIRMFWPLWNSETKTCWGMSKHGDAAATRKNRRSPWDVVHPGRGWALDCRLEDAMTPDEIHSKIQITLTKTPPRVDHASLLEEILMAFRQDDEGAEDTSLVPPVGADASGPTPDEAGGEEQ